MTVDLVRVFIYITTEFEEVIYTESRDLFTI